MDEHKKKMIAPVVVTACFLIFYIVYFAFLIFNIPGVLLKITIGIIPLVIMGVLIFVCVQRIKEIKGGEEDDLSKY